MMSYANLPDRVLIGTDESGNATNYIDKDIGFYIALTVFAVTNILFFLLLGLFKRSSANVATIVFGWISALVVLINLFFAFAAAFIGILNSRENFDYSNFGYLIFVIGGLFVIWLFGFLINLIKVKF